jgi:uncharacterized membrane protein YdbT with pleckstrin-like domain
MADLIVRPSTKLILGSYGLAVLVLIAGAILPLFGVAPHYWYLWIIPGLLYLCATAYQHMGLLMNKLVISEDRLHHESGFIAKQTHTIDLAKVQDVRVEQSVKQRLMNMGTVTVETAGGGSQISIANVDGAQKVADEILSRSKHSPHL